MFKISRTPLTSGGNVSNEELTIQTGSAPGAARLIYKQNDKFGNPTEYPIASNYIQPVTTTPIWKKYNTWKYITDPQDSSKYLLTTDARSICGISYLSRTTSNAITPIYIQQPYQNIAKYDFVSTASSSASADSTPSVTTSVYNDQWSDVAISSMHPNSESYTELLACEGYDSAYNYRSISFSIRIMFDSIGRARAFATFFNAPGKRSSNLRSTKGYRPTTFKLGLNGEDIGFFDVSFIALQNNVVVLSFVSNFVSCFEFKHWSNTTITSLSFERVNITYVAPQLTNIVNLVTNGYTYTYDSASNRWSSPQEINTNLINSMDFEDLWVAMDNNSYLDGYVSTLQAMSKVAWLNNWIIDISSPQTLISREEFVVTGEGMGYTDVLASGTHFRGLTDNAKLLFQVDLQELDVSSTASSTYNIIPLPVIAYIAELTLENLEVRVTANTLGTDEHEYNENDLWGRIDLLPVQHPTDSKGLSIINCEISKFVIRSYNCSLKIINSRIYLERTDTFDNSGDTDSENFKTYEYKSKYHPNAVVSIPSINSGLIWSDTYIHNSYLKLCNRIHIVATKYAGQAAYDYDPILRDGISFEMHHSNLTVSDELNENVSITYPIDMNQNVRPYIADITGCYITCIDGKTSISSVSDIISTSTSNVSGTSIKIDNCVYNNVLAANNLYYYKN